MAWTMERTRAEPDQFEGNAMRITAGLILAGAVSLCASSAAWSQTPAPKAPAAPPAPAAARPAKPPCANPDAIGIARVVEIDTTGGAGVGFEHFKQLDFLREKGGELAFDSGPWPGNTPSVLKTVAWESATRVFLSIG